MRTLPMTVFKKGQIPHNRGLRHDAVLRGDTHYFTGYPCKNGHIEKRIVSNGCCMACVRLTATDRRALRTPEQLCADREYSRQNAVVWRKNNPDHENTKVVKRRWTKENPEKTYANVAKRRSAKIRRMPNWLNAGHRLEIDSVYALCNAWRSIGFDYHVDHIAPLQGKSVSGLHVPWNLQILPAKENISKGNRYE